MNNTVEQEDRIKLYCKQKYLSAFLISRKLGLIQYSLTHVTAPHTAKHIFKV